MYSIENHNINIKPFLRWAGGKIWFTKYLEDFLPEKFNNYFEPFVGGGSVFIYLKNRKLLNNLSYISDSNPSLINSYIVIKNNPEELILELKKFKNTEKEYYKIRSTEFSSNIQKAAKFIFLNRTSFNGIYRENLKGVYNVPYGNKKYKLLFDFNNIRNLSSLFNNSFFQCYDFEELMPKIQKNDLVFLDPPYTVAHQHNGFVKYNQKIFSWEDQLRLKKFIDYISKKQAYFILTNAAHQCINELYENSGNFFTLSRASVVGGKNAKRSKYDEIIITNI